MTYVALLRGINVGGNSMIKMADLKICLEKAGLKDLHTYIQSGNIIFSSDQKPEKLTSIIEEAIKKQFEIKVPALVLSKAEYQEIIKSVPSDWGQDKDWKYNLLFLLPPYNTKQIISDIGELKPGLETLTAGKGVLYQSLSIKLFGITTTGKLASLPIYKRMTIRNHRTGQKISDLLGHE